MTKFYVVIGQPATGSEYYCDSDDAEQEEKQTQNASLQDTTMSWVRVEITTANSYFKTSFT